MDGRTVLGTIYKWSIFTDKEGTKILGIKDNRFFTTPVFENIKKGTRCHYVYVQDGCYVLKNSIFDYQKAYSYLAKEQKKYLDHSNEVKKERERR